MKLKKIRSAVYILDNDRYIGKVKTMKQGEEYIGSADKMRDRELFEPEIQKLIDLTAAVEDEIGYEFETKKEIVSFLKTHWPEVYDVEVNFTNNRFSKIYLSGHGWSGVITFSGNKVIFRAEDMEEINEFNKNCKQYGFEIEDYKRVFQAFVNGGFKKLMPIGFKDGKVVLQLADGYKIWTAPAATVLKGLNS